MLSAQQSDLANCFAGRCDDGPPFDFSRAMWRRAITGAPVLEAAAASFDSTLESSYDAGTHRVVTGRVQSACSSQHQPLAYSRRAYRALRPLQN